MKTISKLMEGFSSNENWVKTKIFDFLTNEDLSMTNIKKLSTEIDVEESLILKHIFSIVDSFFKEGKYNNMIKRDSNFKVSSDELNIGIRFELEHTTDINIARRIALDHLTDCDTYYTKLEKLEKSCE